jgi:hypothetical protein
MRSFALAFAFGFVFSAAQASPLPFIDDDYARALAQAKKEHKPIFVESWAPW